METFAGWDEFKNIIIESFSCLPYPMVYGLTNQSIKKRKSFASFLNPSAQQMQKKFEMMNMLTYLPYNVEEITRKRRYYKQDP